MPTDKTAGERVRRQRKQRLSESWHEVKVWVPTQEDADDIRNLAATKRTNAERLIGLSREVKSVNIETEERIAQAIAQHGSEAYITESGAVLELLTKLADEGDLQGFSKAFVIFARAKPTNAKFIEAAVPAKIHRYWCKRKDISIKSVNQWCEANPEWPKTIKGFVRNPIQFQAAVEASAEDIRSKN